MVDSNTEVRTRMAPSPTGELHLGGVRTALFSWLWARRNNGKFFLRVEDTDQARFVPGSMERIYESLAWLGMTPDPYENKPYIKQSDRLSLYQEIAHRLVEEGKAYYCFATPEELEAMRNEQQANHLPPRYDNRWGYRDLSLPEAKERIAKGERFVVRQKMPLDGAIVFRDVINGEISVDAATLDDHVLLKADGYPTYHLANVIDDHDMQTTHVLRAQEWLPSAPRHIVLYQALGWEAPEFVHVPIILGPDKGKLSKRHGAQTILDYREAGYLPEAILNFLVFLGWSTGTEEEIFSPAELIARFDLSGLHASPARFDPARLLWFNGIHIRRLNQEGLRDRLLAYWQRDKIWLERYQQDKPKFEAIVAELHDRLTTLKEFGELAEVFYTDPQSYSPELIPAKKQTTDEARIVLEKAETLLRAHSDWTGQNLELALRGLAETNSWKAGDLLWPLRVALTGLPTSPGVFEMLVVLGQETSLRRIAYARELLGYA